MYQEWLLKVTSRADENNGSLYPKALTHENTHNSFYYTCISE